MTDPNVLVALAFQRRVLDWRDNADADITRTMTTLFQALSRYVRSMLGESGLLDYLVIFDYLLSDTADNALQYEFMLQVQQPMRTHLYELETALTALATQEMPAYEDPIVFRKASLDTEEFCQRFYDLRFKGSERENIVCRLETWMLGPDGLAAEFQQQAAYMADKLIKERQTC